MKAEDKQALIEWAHKWIEPAGRIAQDNPADESAQASLRLYEIALAALESGAKYITHIKKMSELAPAVNLAELVPDEMPRNLIDEVAWRSEKKDGLHCYHMENLQRVWSQFRDSILRNIEEAK